ncbi:MauE/DoxX family redox-associated membrane protein [Parapedobacter sp. GCM10030251]|uniref:MauE/DoxX family redox-associated membrane protein n=1 Tax=Parapedobacter sp. GCM10030251 TaxID=3273419 RepID=UPI00361D7421
MNKHRKHIAKRHITKGLIFIVRLTLVVLWVPVAADKLWDLKGFHSVLLRQPIPDWWAGILFWLLPLLELLAAVLIAWRKNRRRNHQGMWFSGVLMLGFTLFILFGVLGWYEKRPCGCGSVISGLSWENHLWFNTVFFLLSVLGIWFTRAHAARRRPYRRPIRLFFRQRAVSIRRFCRLPMLHMRFPRKFAVFRRRAVEHRSQMQEACSRQPPSQTEPCMHIAGKTGMPLNFTL